MARQFRGPEDAMTLGILAGLAHGYEQAGRLEDAIVRAEELVAIRRKLDPDLEKPATVTAMKDLAGFYEATGAEEKAKAIRAEIPEEGKDEWFRGIPESTPNCA